MEKITLSDLRDEVKEYNGFCLDLEDALEPTGIHMYYSCISVYLNSYPCIVLQNEMGRTALKHIRSAKKGMTNENDAEYTIRCERYLGNKKSVYIDYKLSCFNSQ